MQDLALSLGHQGSLAPLITLDGRAKCFQHQEGKAERMMKVEYFWQRGGGRLDALNVSAFPACEARIRGQPPS